MKTIALRSLDDLGRIVLPADIRKQNNWTTETQLEVSCLDDETVVIKEARPFCCVCGSCKELSPVKTKHICSLCAESIR